jgi:hypothetical protein
LPIVTLIMIMSTCHFVNLPFCQLAILSTCHFVKMAFVNLPVHQIAFSAYKIIL